MPKNKIMYCATPTRFTQTPKWPQIKEKIKEMARNWGYAPVIPFDIGSYEDFEKGIIGREGSIEYMLYVHAYPKSDTGIVGISDGTMGEFRDALDLKKEIRVDLSLDPEWEKYYEELKPKYGDLFARLRGPNYLIALVGPRAIGKTFWSERLMKIFPEKLQRVKNTTTRDIRKGTPEEEKRDCASYNFVSKEEFEKGIQEDRFLEYVQDKEGNYYGSSFQEIKRILQTSSGIFALTPPGIRAIYERRFEINLKIIRMIPEATDVLKKNFLHRPDLSDPAQQQKLLAEANQFTLPEEVEHDFILIKGDAKLDQKKLLSIVQPLIK